MPLAAVDWTLVYVALIGAVPATIAAVGTLRNGRRLRTRNGQTIGDQMEDTLQTSIANNFRLKALADEFDVPMPDKASAVESQVEALNTLRTREQRRPNG